ncbi:DUF5811 family protein [Halorientalis litorea]|jgi:hypothetical protein|uniref:DUF5811 family protein n=1 Tax=Halorientalis litorea TaxID=2931977 RepID=UPI001FF2EEE4|nr:DUF5811 family protein [Halorientalis litorea]
MYGNTPFAGADGGDGEPVLTTEQRRHLRRDLASVAAETRELLPDEFAVGLELARGANGPRATVAVQPPIGSVVSAGYTPEDDADLRIGDDERTDLAHGLAASAALQVKQAMAGDTSPTAQ